MLESNARNMSAAASSFDDATEVSVVDAVLWACDLTEDETEVGDLVAAALRRADVLVVAEPSSMPIEACPSPV